jgi:transcriptional regulator with XRE-family HTH domain
MSTTKIRRIFGKRVRQLRKTQGFSQESFADAAELHRTYIGAIERGEQNVSLDNIERIAKALKVDIVELFKNR